MSICKEQFKLSAEMSVTSNKMFLYSCKNQQIHTCKDVYYSLHRHVLVTRVTILRVSYSKITNNTPVISQKMRTSLLQGCYQLYPVNTVL
jgi:hypothetical protein